MSLRYFWIDLRRTLRNTGNLVFVIGLPVAMYLVFGSTFASGDALVGRGNVQFYVMVSMAVYGASTAATAISGEAALELMQGWGRQLGITPLRQAEYIFIKVLVALVKAGLAVAAVFLVGVLTGARAAQPWVWLASFLLAWFLSSLFALYGLAIAQTFKSESAVSVASVSLVLMSFFGDLFVPLSGTMLSIARFTPMYGYAALARWPQLEGQTSTLDGIGPANSFGSVLLNYLGWAAIFAAVAIIATRRSRQRQ